MPLVAKAERHRATRLLMPKPIPDRPAPGPHGRCGRTDRLALFACALSRESALELLEGLCEPQRTQARRYAQQVAAWDSPTRQAKVAFEFGLREDAAKRLREEMAEAGPSLRFEMFRLLPPYLRTLFPDLAAAAAAPVPPVPPGLAALAQRLVREATR